MATELTASEVDPSDARWTTKELLGIGGRVLSWTALTVAVLVALVLIVVPLALGATPYTVLTGSMEPSMPAGTLVVTRPKPVDEIPLGAVITYQLESNQPAVVTHRVVGVGQTSDGERQFLTRGDANNLDDDPVLGVQVRGVVVYAVPYLGYLNAWVGVHRPGWLLKGVAGALIVYGLVLAGAGVRERLHRRGEPDEADVPVVLPTVDRADDRALVAPSRRNRVPLALTLLLGLVVVGVVVGGSRRSR